MGMGDPYEDGSEKNKGVYSGGPGLNQDASPDPLCVVNDLLCNLLSFLFL